MHADERLETELGIGRKDSHGATSSWRGELTFAFTTPMRSLAQGTSRVFERAVISFSRCPFSALCSLLSALLLLPSASIMINTEVCLSLLQYWPQASTHTI